MLDLFGLPSATQADVQQFNGNSKINVESWQQWLKPRGKTMASILLVGAGGNGGAGVRGANSTAAGGGGGGSGEQSRLIIPISLLPHVLYVSCGTAGSTGVNSFISVAPNSTTNHLILKANPGSAGGAASGATGGAGGVGATAGTISGMPLAGLGVFATFGGQNGIIGGAAVAGAALTLPVTGLIVTGGTGGGGLPAAAAAGTNGGSFVVPAAPTIYPPHSGGVGSATATVPANPGNAGTMGFSGLMFGYGGTGAASTHGTATGGGLVQGRGGNGAPGCGGGGMGGALTGSAAAVNSLGGEGFCIITCW